MTKLGLTSITDPGTGKVIGSSGGVATAVYPPGYEIPGAYAENTTTSTNITATTEGTATTYITAGSITGDGAFAVIVDVEIPIVDTPALAGQNLYLVLFEGATSKGNLGRIASPAAAAMRVSFRQSRRIVPPASAVVYTVKSYVDSGTGVLRAGAGSAGVEIPASIRITRV